MAYEDNIKQIVRRKLHYIVASRQSERDEWLSEFEELEGFEEVCRSPSPLNPFQKKSEVKIKKIHKDGMTYVLCVSSGRVEKDKAIGKKQEKKFLRDTISYNSGCSSNIVSIKANSGSNAQSAASNFSFRSFSIFFIVSSVAPF
ncbi:MAG: hypothetical protein HZA14_10950 [Nitrospirae bacterium]|nr:hypothetical protein [Nitrospirota bacterium]